MVRICSYLMPVTIFVIAATFGVEARAANMCDVNTCIAVCSKRNPQAGLSNYCSRNCLVGIEEAKKKGKCK
jgi:hypothetical protein